MVLNNLPSNYVVDDLTSKFPQLHCFDQIINKLLLALGFVRTNIIYVTFVLQSFSEKWTRTCFTLS